MLHSLRCFIPKDYDYEVLIVTTDSDCSIIQSEYPEIRIIWEEIPRGVYAAMNMGIGQSKGDYLYFSGQDDHVLSGFTKLLETCIELELDYCVGSVFWGDSKIFYSTRSKYVLWFNNWCHQAIVYRRSLFDEQKYNENYRIQADHAINLCLRHNSKHRVKIIRSAVAWFSGAGLSSSNKDYIFWADVPRFATLYCRPIERSIVKFLHYLISSYSKMKNRNNINRITNK
ncbi:hypothetical protein DSLASN_21060 [Desulfoluna limicola]|uniref:Glycosyltransferase 2-like domain-containing protein n=1 Tax=Desulfoluna limicola TaxID=2810562 RepID=A0ABM7PHB7_9BACT|nr:hypothetical protein DSLASN_21060 [Desulfoluna limicola]